MAITDWPEMERPREKLLQQGAAALSNAELLAIFLRTGIKGHTAVDLARQMLGQYEGLRGLFSSSLDEFSELPGMGKAKYAQLQAVLELARRHLAEKMHREDTLTDPATARTYLQTRLRDYPYEVFACLFLDNRHRVIAFEELFRGTINGASVHPREVVRRCLGHNAAAVILAHNHPSGVAEPSEADRSLTRRLSDTLGMVDVRVLDHIIVGDGETLAFSERGLI